MVNVNTMYKPQFDELISAIENSGGGGSSLDGVVTAIEGVDTSTQANNPNENLSQIVELLSRITSVAVVGKASDVQLDSIEGLSADNVQAGINELYTLLAPLTTPITSNQYTNLNSKATIHSFRITKIGRLCTIVLQFSLNSSMTHNEILLKIPTEFRPINAIHSCFMSYDGYQYVRNLTLDGDNILVGSPNLESRSWYSGYYTFITAS